MFCDNDDVTTTATWNSSKGGLDLFTSGPNKCTVNFGKTHTVKVVVESHGSVDKAEQEVQPNGTSETFTVIPEEGYGVKIIACTNNQKVERMENTFKVVNVTSDTKCTVTMSKTQPLFNYCIENEQLSTCLPKAKEDLTLIEDDTKDNNIRYFGTDEDVHNYIWFNCDDYNGDMNETNCEKWRIIGYMKDKSRVKIIRADSIGKMKWDTSGTYGSNKWTRPADLNTQLNEIYYKGTELNSIKGITDATRDMIEEVTWNLGGYDTTSVTAQTFYDVERKGSTWPGYIGLMYPSDYGYAADKTCWSTNISSYNSSCMNSDWLYIINTKQWTLTPHSSGWTNVFYVNISDDGDSVSSNYAFASYAVRPSLYLNSSVKIKSGAGDGSSTSPYVLIP